MSDTPRTLDLSAANVFETDMSAEAARQLVDDLPEDVDDLATELDKAQGHVYDDDPGTIAYLVITIIK